MVTVFISAFLASAAFEPIGIWYAAIVGFALFFRKLRSSNNPLRHSLFFGFILNAIVLHWSGKYVGALPWLLLASLQAIFYLPIGWIYLRTRSFWWIALTLLLMEELRSRVPFGGFGWTRVAFSQVDSPALPIVSLGGVLALTALTILIAILLTKIQLRNLLAVAMIFLAANFLPANPEGSGSIRLLAVQGNTPEVGLDFNSRAKAVFNLHRDATREYSQGNYDAIVWPENSIDIDPKLHPDVAADITTLTKELGAPLIAGVVQKGVDGPENASIMYSEEGLLQSSYIKRGLTPFGEYMPFRKIAEFISPQAERVIDFIPGDRRVVQNSKALIVQTNSATFANTPESAQQLAIMRIRAVEHSRDILAVSTVGISAFIDNNGRIISKTSENKESFLIGELKISTHKTLINRIYR